jgi:type VI secretion system protein ImpB
MADTSSQKLIGKNNAPRVQIEYDVEVYGSQKKVQLPFVTGVMADLSGQRVQSLPGLDERKFVEVDVDNFDAHMRTIKSYARFHVDNTLDRDGSLLDVDLSFNSMDDFSPGAIARRIPQMAALLEARERLTQLITYMDGKASAEETVHVVKKPEGWLLLFTSDNAFASAQELLNPDYRHKIARMGQALAPWPGALEVVGHTDNQPIRRGRYRDNEALSLARAETVQGILKVSANTLQPNRMIGAVGRGDQDPIADNASEAGRRLNRRVDILWKVAADDGRP